MREEIRAEPNSDVILGFGSPLQLGSVTGKMFYLSAAVQAGTLSVAVSNAKNAAGCQAPGISGRSESTVTIARCCLIVDSRASLAVIVYQPLKSAPVPF